MSTQVSNNHSEVIVTRIVLTALNASYAHTPLALYALKAYCAPFFNDITLASYTINHTDGYILRNLYTYQPDIIGFSCAIWNIEKTVRIATLLKKLLPSVVVIFGGPEVANRYEPYLLGTPINATDLTDTVAPVDIVVPGEGEKPLFALLKRFADAADAVNTVDIADIAGIAWVENGSLRVNPPEAPLDMTALPFPYPVDLQGLSHKILYFEASRGCPFRCGYCLSSAQSGYEYGDAQQRKHKGASQRRYKGARQPDPDRHQYHLRLRPLTRVFDDLRVFIDARVVRVKFTDRTFNADKTYAAAIWQFLMAHDNGVTNFHFEIAADLLDEAALSLLSQARPGLFQFEIGVQSVNPAALAAVERTTNIHRLFENVARIKAFRNIHLHLDLIVGLPDEDFASCQTSFNQTYAARPEQLQLGFLKLLKGAPLYPRAAALGLVFSPFPPYEVLSTPVLSYADILRLKAVEEMTEIYHNSGRFTHTLDVLLSLFDTPFALFDRLAEFWFDRAYHLAPQSKNRLYEILLAFCISQADTPDRHMNRPMYEHTWRHTLFKDLLRFDLLANENEKSIPAALNFDPPADIKRRIRANTVNRRTTSGRNSGGINAAGNNATDHNMTGNTATGNTATGNTATGNLSPGRYIPAERLAFFETDVWALINDQANRIDLMPTKRICCLCFSYPGPGRQSPFTLAQRVKEIVL